MSVARIFKGSPLIIPYLYQPWINAHTAFDFFGNRSITFFPQQCIFWLSFQSSSILRCLDQFNLACPLTIQCLTEVFIVLLAIKKFKVKNIYRIQTLYEFSTFTCCILFILFYLLFKTLLYYVWNFLIFLWSSKPIFYSFLSLSTFLNTL